MSTLALTLSAHEWRLREPFVIARQVLTSVETIRVSLAAADGAAGYGEAVGLDYEGETPAGMMAQIEAIRPALEAGVSRDALLPLLPAGGARCAVDAALWDFESKRGDGDPFTRTGLHAGPVRSFTTIGIREPAACEAFARDAGDGALLKIKVGRDGAREMVAAVRRGAPGARLIVDANQAWTSSQLKALAPAMADMGVELLEQPLPVGEEAGLDGWIWPVPLCADESFNTESDLDAIAGRFAAVNIKLDKAGGLTAAVRLADAAQARGLALMVGSMAGPSLSVAPAMVLAQRCRWADLDGPPLLARDSPHGFAFDNGLIAEPHRPLLWG